MKQDDKNQLIYDLPVRLFHWSFAGLFLTSFFIAKFTDDESLIFSYHMISGLILLALTWLRIIWGMVGSHHAKFINMPLHPRLLIQYFKNLVKKDAIKWSGHNPASAWASILMMASAIGLGITGFFMAKEGTIGAKESFEDLHELLAHVFLATVIVHILGVAMHSLRFKDQLLLSMLNGKKNLSDASARPHENKGETKPRWGVAIFYVLFFLGTSSYFLKSFDPKTKSLHIFKTTLHLGENEDENEHQNEHQNEYHNEYQNESKDEGEDDDD